MRTQTRYLALAVAILIACSASVAAQGGPVDQVQQALNSVDAWLGDGANAESWGAYLKLPALREQLEKGSDANLDVVKQVAAQLHSDAAGLDRERFVKLRQAVDQWAEELQIEQTGLPETVLAAKDQFRPITAEDVAEAKSQLQSAADKLNAYLSGDNGAAWKKYLDWPLLEKQLASDDPDVNDLVTVYRKLTADEVGLELPVFANVADGLERYINLLAAHRDDNLREQYGKQLEGLAEGIKQLQEDPSDDNRIAVGSRLGWLENREQVPDLIAAIRRRLSEPNLYLVASERLLGAGIAQELNEVTPVRDYILGTSIRGNGRTIGKVRLELVPSDDQLVFDTMLSGNVNSRTVGYNGPATIYSNGSTAISGRKRIVFDENGFASYKATGAANTNTRVTGIGGSGIVRRVASRRVGQQKAQAERIAADHAADRVSRRMDDQVADQLSEAHANYLEKVRNPLLRRREFPSMRFRTTEEELFLTVLAANSNQIAALGTPPDVTVENSDLAVQIHESMINNLAAALLGGVTLEEEEVQQRVIDLRGSLPESLESDEDRDPWSITFARTQPVTVSFGDETVTITIRGQRYTSGEQSFRAMNVTAVYKIAIDEPDENGVRGIKLVRQGELDIVPPGEARRLSGREITLRTLLEKRFGKLFEAEVKYGGLILPGQWRKAGILTTDQLTSKGGWVVGAWSESGVPAPPEDEPDPDDGKSADQVTRAAE
ncbi:MAG: hypothetical protein DWQ37_15750 [Planctomycetota bacterium]|nr:MAG: hypothetical protein DWQ37_15750 [Planctomycetota bacterium]